MENIRLYKFYRIDDIICMVEFPEIQKTGQKYTASYFVVNALPNGAYYTEKTSFFELPKGNPMSMKNAIKQRPVLATFMEN